jgi:hypothetical protein
MKSKGVDGTTGGGAEAAELLEPPQARWRRRAADAAQRARFMGAPGMRFVLAFAEGRPDAATRGRTRRTGIEAG